MTLIAHLSALLLQGAVAVPETTVVRSVASGPGWYTIFREVAGGATLVVFLIMLIVLIPAVLRVRKTIAQFEGLLAHLERSIDPISKHVTRVADNVDYISTSIRADVQDLRTTLHTANSGIRQVIDSSERRLHELGAVLRVVQEEAEHAFVSTASTLRGVRAGAATFRDEGARLAPRRSELDDELDDEQESIADLDDMSDLTDMTDMEALDDDAGDFDAALDAAEDSSDGYDNGSTYGRQEPRIKRARRGERG